MMARWGTQTDSFYARVASVDRSCGNGWTSSTRSSSKLVLDEVAS